MRKVLAVACLVGLFVAACDGGGTSGASWSSRVKSTTPPALVPDRWRVSVKRLASADGGASERLISERTVGVDGRTIRTDGLDVSRPFLPAGTGAMFLHAVAYAGDQVVLVADGAIGDGNTGAFEVRAVAYAPECDLDADTFRDCSNVAAACCSSIAEEARAETADCLDDRNDLATPRLPDAKRRLAEEIHPFQATERGDDYAVCQNGQDDECVNGDVRCDEVDGDGDMVLLIDDCDDTDGTFGKGKYDLPGDEIDQDCDGSDGFGVDADRDGYKADDPVLALRDCDDADPFRSPGRGESACDGIDQDCSGEDACLSDGRMADLDGDGLTAPADCDDHDAGVRPGRLERCGDGVDQDCSGGDVPCAAEDLDHDGLTGADDCNEMNAAVHAGAPEACGNTVDEDCDGADLKCAGTTDDDADNFPLPADCNDDDISVRPGAAELCNNVDDDCDGIVDEGNPRLFFGDPRPHAELCGVDMGDCRQGPYVCTHDELGMVLDLCLGEQGTAEVCDGLDNDCDRLIDVRADGVLLPGEGEAVCGPEIARGICRTGFFFCAAGALSECRGAVLAAEETCDGRDEDCDGNTDEAPQGGEALFAECYDGAVETHNIGDCHGGLRRCEGGFMSACIGQVLPGPEDCDGRDEDCDAAIDENVSEPCWELAPERRNIGACEDGRRLCVDGMLGACLGQVEPTGEICDGDDNDCNGIDDQFTVPCYDGRPEELVAGRRCHRGLRACMEGLEGRCEGQQVAEVELCNSQDDDCDGMIDENFDLANDPNSCGRCANVCPGGGSCCNRSCRLTNTTTDCGACGVNCGDGADECGPGPDGRLTCLCGENAACEGDLVCSNGACICQNNDDCPSGQLCCNQACVATSADGPCAECNDGGCAGAQANACVDRACQCGESGPCPGNTTCDTNGEPGAPFQCLGCSDDGDCPNQTVCCGNVCTAADPARLCEACNTRCDSVRADRCLDVGVGAARRTQCSCGDLGTPCVGGSQFQYCVGSECEECRNDVDCPIGRRSCVDNVCRACDPSNHENCAADQLCCNFQCVSPGRNAAQVGPNGGQSCESCGASCDVASTNLCTNRDCRCGAAQPCSGNTPFCNDALVAAAAACVQCRDDVDCTGHANGGQCVANVCTQCDPNGHDGCAANLACCGAAAAGQFRCEATGPSAGDQCEACDIGCDVESTNRCTGRACLCGNSLPCDGNLPVCLDATGVCAMCDDDNDCAGRPEGPRCVGNTCRACVGNNDCGGGQCVANVCRACNPADHVGCAANQLCCNFVCEATGPGALEQCGACDVACPQDPTNLCTNRSCRCGNGNACVAPNGYCNDNGQNAICVVCRNDNDCPANAHSCISGVCRTCDPTNGAADEGCVANSNIPVCAANFICQACLADADCSENGTGGYCNEDTGRCRVCDAASDAPCALTLPICDQVENRCEDCVEDLDCANRPGAENQCVGGDCRLCDSTNGQLSAGCDRASNLPVCGVNPAVCRGCMSDLECTGNPSGGQCYQGRCGDCDPTEAQCDRASATPVCDTTTLDCEACAGDAECAAYAGRQQCVAGRCQPCDIANSDGCNEVGLLPICGNGPICRNCANDGECFTRSGDRNECVNNQCRLCDPALNHRGCTGASATPICDGGSYTCRGCANDGECTGNASGGQCVAGSCKLCDTGDSSGCDLAAVPICVNSGANNACQACANDAQCVTRSGSDDECVAGQCRPCDSSGGLNTGCVPASNSPICANFLCVGCLNDAQCAGFAGGATHCIVGGANPGACRACDPLDDEGCLEGAAAPICAINGGVYACQACAADQECGDHPGSLDQCVAGNCRACDPTVGQSNAGCTPSGTAPICNAGNFTCRACNANGECAANASGLQCVEGGASLGACRVCDPDDDSGCVAASDAPSCEASGGNFACLECSADLDCTANPTGLQCIGAGIDQGECHPCDPANHAPCANGQACIADACADCAADADCTGHPSGEVCEAGNCLECFVTADCNVGLGELCDVMSNTCRACVGHDECVGHPNGTACVGGACGPCTLPDNRSCELHPTGNICGVGNVCRACANNNDCRDNSGWPNNYNCVAGNCVP